MLGQKWADYSLFKDAVQLIKNKEHLNKPGFNKVFCIRDSMNLCLYVTLLQLNWVNL